MTDATTGAIPASAPTPKPKSSLLTVDALTKKRNASEIRFKYYGIAAITVSLSVLAIMLWTIFSDGLSAFKQATFTFPVTLDAERLDPNGNRDRAEMMGDGRAPWAMTHATASVAGSVPASRASAVRRAAVSCIQPCP